ncbi:MAG: hypothetical protein QXS20_00650 [Candidatus Thorarchaeota archaeon]
MTIRVKEAFVESMNEAEIRGVRVLKASMKEPNGTLMLELPEVLCGSLSTGDQVGIVIDDKPLKIDESVKLCAEGTVFEEVEMGGGYRVTATIGGLRMVLESADLSAAQRDTFSSGRFFVVLR